MTRGINQKENRLGEERYNYQGYLMRIAEYIDANNMIVEFEDEYKTKVCASYRQFDDGGLKNPNYRIDKISINHQGCPMMIVEYGNANNMVVEFQDEYKGRVHTNYWSFTKGNVKNPYHPMVLGVGRIGVKYPSKINDKTTKEYQAWKGVVARCFDEKYKQKHPTYKDVTCCKEWLLYENFYEWLHNQENFDKWGDKRWEIDKDILIKRNKVYSPETCLLVPNNINSLFLNASNHRGDLPIGVRRSRGRFMARCNNPITKIREYLGTFDTPLEAFYVYKKYKEDLIKQIAQIEYDKGNISKKCYEAMLNYEVEITD